MEKCKRCLLRECAEKDIYNDIAERIKSLKQEEKVSDSVYMSRLALCKECEHLLSGVCMKCGCYVEFRSAFKNQHCPLTHSKRKW